MANSMASTVPPGRQFASPTAAMTSQSRHDDWRRPACSDACTARRVLVADGEFRGWRDVVTHDHVAYEQRLEATVLALAGLLASAVLPPVLDPTAALLGMLLAGQQTAVRTGPLVIDLLMDTLWIDGRRVPVSPIEWEVLVLLASRLGELVSYEDLALWIWPSARLHVGRAPSHQPSRQSIRAIVGRLRDRLGDAGDLLATVASRGVMLRSVAPHSTRCARSGQAEVS